MVVVDKVLQMKKRMSRDKGLLLISVIVSALSDPVHGDGEHEYDADDYPTLTQPSAGNYSEMYLNLPFNFGNLPPTDWLAFEEYWSSLLNYSALSDDDDAKAFIMSFPTDMQRIIIATQLSYCPFVGLCSHSLDTPDADFQVGSCCGPCSCQQNCTDYNTCCPDLLVDLHDFSGDPTQACIPLHLNTNLKLSPYSLSVYAINRCPATSARVDMEKCEQTYVHGNLEMTDIIPAWHGSSGVLYRNVHCATCNGIRHDELNYFEPKIGCYGDIPTNFTTNTELITYVLGSNACDIGFISDSFEFEYCQSVISRCNVTRRWAKYNPDHELACLKYTSILRTDEGLLFKNVFCAFCNGYIDVPRTCPVFHFSFQPAPPFSFSGLLNLAGTNNDDGNRKCGAELIFHDIANECIQAGCSSLRRLVGNECVPISKSVARFNYEVLLRLTLSETHSISEAVGITEHVVLEIKRYLGTLVEDPNYLLCNVDIGICSAYKTPDSKVSCSADFNDIWQAALGHFLLRLQFSITDEHDQDEIVAIFLKNLHLDISNITGVEQEAIIINIINDYEAEFKPGNLTFCSSYDNRVLIWHPPLVSAINICDVMIEYKPVLSLLPCPMIQVSNDSYPWNVDDDGVTFTKSGHIFSHRQFYLQNVNDAWLYLCKDQYFELTSDRVTGRWSLSAEHIVSIVLVSLSIISLFVTLAAFVMLAQLRSLPGRNNMALITSLLIAQVLYLVSSFSRLEQRSVSCKIVGMLTHFFWLLVMFWMNVCTFHMFHVLTKTKVMSRGAGTKRYIAYHVYAISCSVVFVGINILVSSVTSGFNDIGYGLSNCYVSSQKMLMYTFAFPLAVVVVSNLGMFLWVIISIKKTSAIQKNVQNERNDIAVFARLSTLTGVTWIFGFIYAWIDSVVLSYVFIILNASQGVFIFISFICTRRVFMMARKRYYGSSLTTRSSGMYTVSTDSTKYSAKPENLKEK